MASPPDIVSFLHHPFTEVTVILLLAALIGAVGVKLRQPLIISFIAVGILVGPSGAGLFTTHEEIRLLAEMGIALLLFVVGLKLDLHLIRTLGPVALAAGMGQILFTALFGFFIGLGLGFPAVHSLYVAVALTFSSTIIIVKLLSDKREIDSLHGRIALGILIVQDLVVILTMIALTALGNPQGGFSWAGILVKGILFLGGIALVARFVFPGALPHLARSQELLVLFGVAWAVTLAALGSALGFSKEVGAFLGGVSLASTPFREAIGARLVSLRDFLLLFFFIDLGARLDLSLLGAQLPAAGVFSLFVLLGNPLIVMVIMGIMGFRKRTGFLTGLTMAQISEFSLILGTLGLALGHITPRVTSLITLVGLVTITLSSYLIIYSGPVYKALSRFLTPFERSDPFRETSGIAHAPAGVDVILFGLGNYGGSMARHLLDRNQKVLGVDFDPQALAYWREKGLPVLYGDSEDPEFFEHLPIHRARWVVITMRDRAANLAVLSTLKARGFSGRVALTAASREEAREFQAAGAAVVLRPFVDAAEQAVDALTAAMHSLPQETGWPLDLAEIRLLPHSAFSGKTIGQVPLRGETGASILAVSRSGKVIFDPKPDFQLFPGDRLVLLGEPEALHQASEFLQRRDRGEEHSPAAGHFTIAPLAVPPGSPWEGRTLADLRFRQRLGASVIGIQRGDRRLIGPSASESIQPGDTLLLAGQKDQVAALVREAAPGAPSSPVPSEPAPPRGRPVG